MNKIFAIVIGMVMMVGTAHAYKPVDYVTGTVTYNDIDLDVNGFGTVNIDKTVGVTVGAGKDIFKNWLAVEGTYGQTGEASIGGTDLGEVKTIGVWLVADPTIFKINHMPVKAIARVGGVYNKVNTHGLGNFYDTGMAYGVGVGLGITKKLDVILDYRVMDVDLVSGVDLNIDTVGLGVNYRF